MSLFGPKLPRWFFPLLCIPGLLVLGYRNTPEPPSAGVTEIVRAENNRLPGLWEERIAEQIKAVAEQYDIDPLLILAVIKIESNFRPLAVSNRGAIGLMQVKPVVVREVGDNSYDRPPFQLLLDPEANIELGVRYLDYLRERFGNDWFYILSAYNMGPTYVNQLRASDRIPPAHYYRKVMRAYRAYQHLHRTET